MLSRKKCLSPEDYKKEVLNVPLIDFAEYVLDDDIYYMTEELVLNKIKGLLKDMIFDIKKFMFSFHLGFIIILRLYYELENLNYIETNLILDEKKYKIKKEYLNDIVNYIFRFFKQFVDESKNYKYSRR